MATEKRKTVGAILEKLNKAYKEALVDPQVGGVIKKITLNSPSLNFIFSGGYALGKIYEFYGPESGGKSTLATYIASEIQKKYTQRPMVLYVDIERSFDKNFAETLGLSTADDDFILLRPLTGEEGFDMMKAIITELPIGLVIWDSLAATPSHGQMEDAFKASYGGTAAVFAEGLKTINPYLDRTGTSMIVINQERANVGKFGPGPDTKTTGGYAIKFYASWRGRITRIDTLRDKGRAVGITSRVRNVKNKVGIPYRDAELNLYFASGFNSDDEYVQFMINLNVINRKGAWYDNEELSMHVQGKDAVLQYLRQQPQQFEALKRRVDELMNEETVLDITELPDDLKADVVDEPPLDEE